MTSITNMLPLTDEELTQLHCLVVGKMLELRQQTNSGILSKELGSLEIKALGDISNKMAKYRTMHPSTSRSKESN